MCEKLGCCSHVPVTARKGFLLAVLNLIALDEGVEAFLFLRGLAEHGGATDSLAVLPRI